LGACVREFEQVVLLGDSAGGNLALSACLRVMSSLHGPEAIAGLALLSPWCDLREEAASIQANLVAHSPFNHEDSLEYSRMYLAGHDASDARVSPLLSPNFEGLPPVYLEWALDEFLAPDIASLSEKMTQAGVSLETRMEPQAVHGWQLLPDFLPEAKRSTSALGDWVRIRLGLQRA
jgi:acetyl esterase/lipase